MSDIQIGIALGASGMIVVFFIIGFIVERVAEWKSEVPDRTPLTERIEIKPVDTGRLRPTDLSGVFTQPNSLIQYDKFRPQPEQGTFRTPPRPFIQEERHDYR